MRTKFFVTRFVVAAVLAVTSLTACDSSTAPIPPTFLVEMDVSTDSIFLDLENPPWFNTLSAEAFGEVWDLDASFDVEVVGPGKVIRKDFRRQVVQYSDRTGRPFRVRFEQDIEIWPTGRGKVVVTVWLSADRTKKKRFVMVVGGKA